QLTDCARNGRSVSSAVASSGTGTSLIAPFCPMTRPGTSTRPVSADAPGQCAVDPPTPPRAQCQGHTPGAQEAHGEGRPGRERVRPELHRDQQEPRVDRE